MADQQIAVLIDYENVRLNAMRWLFDRISEIGRVIVKRAYADWSAPTSKPQELLELGIEPIQVLHSHTAGKNSSDIRLSIDAIELLYNSPVDVFVIVSSDGDFVPLASKLRSAGKTVVGAGRRAAASQTLVASCDRYFFLDQANAATPAEPVTGQTLPLDDTLLARAMKAAMDEEGRASGSKLLQTMQRLDPSFDYKEEHFSTFAKYLGAHSEVKVTRSRTRGDISVEMASAEAAQETAQAHSHSTRR